MHVIDFIFPEDHDTKSHREQNISDDKCASHYWISCLKGVPEFLSSKDIRVHLDCEEHDEDEENEDTTTKETQLDNF
jgi:hypothetical protein